MSNDAQETNKVPIGTNSIHHQMQTMIHTETCSTMTATSDSVVNQSEQYELANLSKTVEYPIQTESVINERRHSSYEQYDPSLDQHHQSQQRIHLFEEQQQHQHQQTSNNNDNTSNISYEEQVNVIIHQQTERIEFLENQLINVRKQNDDLVKENERLKYELFMIGNGNHIVKNETIDSSSVTRQSNNVNCDRHSCTTIDSMATSPNNLGHCYSMYPCQCNNNDRRTTQSQLLSTTTNNMKMDDTKQSEMIVPNIHHQNVCCHSYSVDSFKLNQQQHQTNRPHHHSEHDLVSEMSNVNSRSNQSFNSYKTTIDCFYYPQHTQSQQSTQAQAQPPPPPPLEFTHSSNDDESSIEQYGSNRYKGRLLRASAIATVDSSKSTTPIMSPSFNMMTISPTSPGPGNLTRMVSRTTAGGSSTSLTSNTNGHSQFGYELSQQLVDKHVNALERKYGGLEAREAAIKIQRAYRSYRLQKRFTTLAIQAICHQQLKQQKEHQMNIQQQQQQQQQQSQTQPKPFKLEVVTNIVEPEPDEPLMTGAIDREAMQQLGGGGNGGQSINQNVGPNGSIVPNTVTFAPTVDYSSTMVAGSESGTNTGSSTTVAGNSMDAYRKRQFRVGLNLFNKTPSERGIRFLIGNGFIEPNDNQELQASNVALFLLTKKGLARQMIGEYIAENAPFNKLVLKAFSRIIDLTGLIIDEALRAFQTHFRFPGEAQKIERVVEAFADRYKECNPGDVLSRDSIFILAFAIIMLNTDLHKPTNTKHRMTPTQWLANLKDVFVEGTLSSEYLLNIYKRIKKQELQTGADHVAQVLKVQSTIIGKDTPNLCVPHRRLVCYCRLYEITDLHRREKIGQHQRDVFLFNDLLLITKTTNRSRNGQMAEYQFRSGTPLDGLQVLIFATAYYANGIRISRRVDDKVIACFNARNDLDQQRFVDDLQEAINEMDDMEQLRITKSSSMVQLNQLSNVNNDQATNIHHYQQQPQPQQHQNQHPQSLATNTTVSVQPQSTITSNMMMMNTTNVANTPTDISASFSSLNSAGCSIGNGSVQHMQ
ncbi:IQ motif and S7 domain-containing protein 1 [Blomia tropicalis]|nr:IQ motif and S7 domain-containing protein 1 [Blomia tropicalis]